MALSKNDLSYPVAIPVPALSLLDPLLPKDSLGFVIEPPHDRGFMDRKKYLVIKHDDSYNINTISKSSPYVAHKAYSRRRSPSG